MKDEKVPFLDAANIPPQFDMDHVALRITKKCSQACVFCFEGTRSGWREPNLEEVKELLLKARQVSDSVIFMGAEALLRRDILDIIRFGSELGLKVAVFTNGLALSRPGFVDALADAGLSTIQVSFHYATADAYARGSRRNPANFERIIRGLEEVHAFNRRNPSRMISVGVETLLLIYNFGHLAQIRQILRDTLGQTLVSHRLTGLVSPPLEVNSGDYLLAPLAGRREELLDFFSSEPKDGPEAMVLRVPLCMIPGWEHRSFDLTKRILQASALCNFSNPDSFRPLLEDHIRAFQRNPFRWICKSCTLLCLCYSAHTSWHNPSMAPRRDQKPIPFTDRTPEEVIARVQAHVARLNKTEIKPPRPDALILPEIKMPEIGLMEYLRTCLEQRGCATDFYVDGEPLFNVSIVKGTVRMDLRLAPPAPGRNGPFYLIKYMCVHVKEGGTEHQGLLYDLLLYLARYEWPDIEDWSSIGIVDVELAKRALAAWDLYGESLWPGLGRFKTWNTRLCWFTSQRRLSLRLEHDSGLEAEIVIPDAMDVTAMGPEGTLRESIRLIESRGHSRLGRSQLSALFELITYFARTWNIVLSRRGLLSVVGHILRARRSTRTEGEQPSSTVADESQQRQGTLEVAFYKGPSSEDATSSFVFYVWEYRPGDPFFMRTQSVAVGYRPCNRDSDFAVLSSVMQLALKRCLLPPSSRNLPEWKSAIQWALHETPNASPFTFEISFKSET